MTLGEYYPTQCEKEILENQGSKIASHLAGQKFNLVELGCGDGAKTIMLLNHFLDKKMKFSFVPLDISKAAVEFLISNLKKRIWRDPIFNPWFGGRLF